MDLNKAIIDCTPDNKVTLTCRYENDWRATSTLKPFMAKVTWPLSESAVTMEGRGTSPVDALYSLANVMEKEIRKFHIAMTKDEK